MQLEAEQQELALQQYAPRWVLRVLNLLILSGLAVLLLEVAGRFAGPDPFCAVWEDSSMLARYADHVLKYHALAWNPGGQPTYGLTAPYYLLVVLPLRLVTPATPLLTVTLASLLCGLAFLALLFVMLQKNVQASPLVRRVVYFVVAASLAGASSDLMRHFLSGMDAMFALAFLCVYLMLVGWWQRSGSLAAAVIAGVVGGLAFGCRPDLMIYTFTIPASLFLFHVERRRKQSAGLMMVLTGVVLLAQMGIAWSYFHSPVPLPFYAKALHLYEGFIGYKYVPVRQWLSFLVVYRFLFLVIAADIVVHFRTWRSVSSPLEKSLLIATGLFMAYYLFFVLQIMYMNQRFYYPTLPTVALLAACSMVRLANRFGIWWQGFHKPVPAWGWAAGMVFCWLLLLPLQASALGHVEILARNGIGSFGTLDEYRAYWGDFWYRMDQFSKLPNDMVIATTELGHPGIMNPDRVVVDFSGLNETAFAKQKFSADKLFQLYQPDLIYMPPRAYQGMVRSLIENSQFRRDYDYYPEDTLTPISMGLAVRRSSKYYSRLHQIVTEPHQWEGDIGSVYQ